MKNYKIRLINYSIPYEEGSQNWQKIVDIHNAINKNNETTIFELCYLNDISPKYYKNLDQLINDGLIQIK